MNIVFVYSTFSDIAIKICYDKYSLYNLKLSYINTFSTITPVNPHLTPRYLQYRTPNPLNCSPHAVSQTFIKHIWFTPILRNELYCIIPGPRAIGSCVPRTVQSIKPARQSLVSSHLRSFTVDGSGDAFAS